jgi:S1-C subfamily serine protease
MHEGFAGGAFVGADGGLLGMATAASIRGLGVVIPASIVWTAVAELLRRGSLKRGYLGIAAQPARVSKAIAVRLAISDQTAKFHLASILGKLGAANRTDAVRRAVRQGLITL